MEATLLDCECRSEVVASKVSNLGLSPPLGGRMIMTVNGVINLLKPRPFRGILKVQIRMQRIFDNACEGLQVQSVLIKDHSGRGC
jgi:hypothetical protein